MRRCLPRALVLLLAFTLLGCKAGVPRAPLELPGRADLEPDRLLIFLHGYLSSAAWLEGFVDAFAREGVPALDSGAVYRTRALYHAHAFDFGRFTRAGSDWNIPVEELAEAFQQFYESLPDSCPVCASRVSRPVEVTLIGHSFGGVVVREFLLQREDRRHGLTSLTPGGGTGSSPWKISRIITTGTPFFGSIRTRFTQGILSVVINGVIRTALLGFVAPGSGGAFGNVIDAQARALRLGSPYLWTSQLRWAALEKTLKARGEKLPPWLVVIAVGNRRAEREGDGVTRFASANVAPLMPGAPMESLVVDIRHRAIVRIGRGGQRLREQRQLLAVMQRFIERGTLAQEPSGLVARYGLVAGPGGDVLLPASLIRESLPEGEPGAVRQWLYLTPPERRDPLSIRDFETKQDRLQRILSEDRGDVWLRFYRAFPGQTPPHPPKVLALRAPLSFFQNGVERSRSWVDLVQSYETSADGEQIPVVQSLAPQRSHLISIPDLRPTGAYRLYLRLERGIRLDSDLVEIRVEGGASRLPWQASELPGVPVWIRPHQANLIHVTLNEREILARHPNLKRVELREVALEPELRLPILPRRFVRTE